MPDRVKDTARVFDAWAKQGRDEGMQTRHALTGGPVLETLRLEGARFLDLGCGNGWATHAAAHRGATAIGIDIAPTMLQRAHATPRAGYAKATFDALPFPPERFDIAFSMEALYYAPRLDAALQEAHRVIKPGGTLHALIDYYEENPASHGWPDDTGVPMHRLAETEWQHALEQARFHDVRTQRIRVDHDATADWKAQHGTLHVHGTRPG